MFTDFCRYFRFPSSLRPGRLALGLVCAVSMSGPASASMQWGMENLMAALSKVNSAALEFKETKRSIFLITNITTRGTMQYRAPGYLHKYTDSPFIERVTIDGDSMLLQRELKTGKSPRLVRSQEFSVQSHPLLRTAVESIQAILAGNQEALMDRYVMDMTGSREDWALSLVPKSPEILEHIEQIELSGSDIEVSRIVTTQADGDASTLELRYLLIE